MGDDHDHGHDHGDHGHDHAHEHAHEHHHDHDHAHGDARHGEAHVHPARPAVLAEGAWLESKASEGGTALERVREQLERARARLR